MIQTQTTQTAPRKSKRGKVISTVIYGLIIVILLGGSIFLFASRAQNNPYPFGDIFGGKAMIWIMSGSMDPVIEEQSYILIERVEPADIVVGDIITFYSDDPALKGNLNTHRVIEIHGEGDSLEFTTKGDNAQTNLVADAYTAKAAKVVGRYQKNLPILTALMRFFLTKAGIATLLLTVCVLTLAVSLPDIIRYFKERAQKAEAERQAEQDRRIAEEVERLKQQNQQASDDE